MNDQALSDELIRIIDARIAQQVRRFGLGLDLVRGTIANVEAATNTASVHLAGSDVATPGCVLHPGLGITPAAGEPVAVLRRADGIHLVLAALGPFDLVASPSGLVIPAADDPDQTELGAAVWDAVRLLLTIGDGTGVRQRLRSERDAPPPLLWRFRGDFIGTAGWQTIPNTTFTKIAFTQNIDDDKLGPEFITIDDADQVTIAKRRYYRVSAHVDWDLISGGDRRARLLVDDPGLGVTRAYRLSNDAHGNTMSLPIEMLVGERVTLEVWQNSGGSRDVTDATLVIEVMGLD